MGGLYLLYLVSDWAMKIKSKKSHSQSENTSSGRLVKIAEKYFGSFWAAVISVELMDLAFSMDNVFAAVAFSNNILIILCGVFIGILAMRFVAQAFVKLMEYYPFLESCAYVVIGLLGIKLSLSIYQHYSPTSSLSLFLNSNIADWGTSVITIGIFIIPIISALLFNFPKTGKNNRN